MQTFFMALYVQEVVCPFCILTYYIKWITTSWTDGRKNADKIFFLYTLNYNYYSALDRLKSTV